MAVPSTVQPCCMLPKWTKSFGPAAGPWLSLSCWALDGVQVSNASLIDYVQCDLTQVVEEKLGSRRGVDNRLDGHEVMDRRGVLGV